MTVETGERISPERRWDQLYERAGPSGVGWYEREASTSLGLITDLGLTRDAALLDVGAGASTLVDGLVARGYSDISVLDASSVGLAAGRARVGPTTAVQWLHHDLLTWRPSRGYDLWHDRAVFHFLVEPDQRDAYLTVLRAAVRPGGHAIIGTFAPDGPERCSGLPVVRYEAGSLREVLQPGFLLTGSRRHNHVTPDGVVQPFTWVVARRGADET